MRKDTKEFIYLLLDFIDVLTKSNSSNALFKIDHYQLMEIKDELFLLMHDDSEKISSDEGKLIPNLIGTLPFILVDKNKFPTNNDIVKFAECSLKLEIPNWEKKSREEIIGRIISQIAAQNESELKDFFEIWNKFNDKKIKQNKKKNIQQNNSNFVDTWLKFFETYNK